MALDLRLVAHAAQAEAVELRAQGVGDRAPDGGLANARRPDEQEDRAADFTLVGTDGQELDDALFDVLQPVMVRSKISRARSSSSLSSEYLPQGSAVIQSR